MAKKPKQSAAPPAPGHGQLQIGVKVVPDGQVLLMISIRLTPQEAIGIAKIIVAKAQQAINAKLIVTPGQLS